MNPHQLKIVHHKYSLIIKQKPFSYFENLNSIIPWQPRAPCQSFSLGLCWLGSHNALEFHRVTTWYHSRRGLVAATRVVVQLPYGVPVIRITCSPKPGSMPTMVHKLKKNIHLKGHIIGICCSMGSRRQK